MWYSTKKMGAEVEKLRSKIHNLPPEMQEERFRAEAEAGWQRIEDCVIQFKAGKNILSGGRFDTLSLGTWMEIVKACDLTYVPAEMVSLAKGTDIFKSGFAPIELDIHPAMLEHAGMVRLDNCGSKILKERFGVRGERKGQEKIQGAYEQDGKFFFVFDDRTTHGVLEYVGQIERDGDVTHPIWWRPWVRAIQIEVEKPKFMGMKAVDKWPLEWRVIIQSGKIAAISSYYIQAPVALTDEVAEQIRAVVRETKQLLSFIAEKNIQPWHPRYIDDRDEKDVSFSFDMISTAQGPAFLEAGPAVPVGDDNIPVEEWGAHPCNFMARKVEGVALSKTTSLPLSQFE